MPAHCVQAYLSGPLITMKFFVIAVAVTFPFFTSAVANVALGVYDFAGGFENANLDIENQFISRCQYQPGTGYKAIEGAASRRRELLLTLEPWSDCFFKSGLFKDVVAGKHDTVLNVVCADIRRAGRPFVRSLGARNGTKLWTLQPMNNCG